MPVDMEAVAKVQEGLPTDWAELQALATQGHQDAIDLRVRKRAVREQIVAVELATHRAAVAERELAKAETIESKDVGSLEDVLGDEPTNEEATE